MVAVGELRREEELTGKKGLLRGKEGEDTKRRGDRVSPGPPTWQCSAVFGERCMVGGQRGIMEVYSLLAPPKGRGGSLLQLMSLGQWSLAPFPPLSKGTSAFYMCHCHLGEKSLHWVIYKEFWEE